MLMSEVDVGSEVWAEVANSPLRVSRLRIRGEFAALFVAATNSSAAQRIRNFITKLCRM